MMRSGANGEDEEFSKMDIKMSDDMPLNGSSGTNVATILGDVPAFQRLSQQKRRQYTVTALIAAGFLFLLTVYLVVSKSGSNSQANNQEDADEVWNELPAAVRQMMDRNAKPCDDFYQYACGKWLVNAAIPGDKTSVHASFTTVEDQNELVLKDIMAEHLPYVGELYGSCMNMTLIDAQGVAPVRGYLKKIKDAADRAALFKIAGELSKMGPNFFTGLSVQADAKDATVYLLYASQSGLSLPDPQYYLDAKQWGKVDEAYEEYLTTLFGLAEYSEADAKANTALVIEFEKALAKLYIPKEELMDPVKTYNPVKIKDAIASYPLLIGQFLAGTTIQAMITNNTAIPAGKQQAQLVSVETPSFFEKAEKLMASTEVATLKVILSYQLLRDFSTSLSEPFIDASFEFFGKRVGGQQQRTPRWKVCLRRVTSHFPDLMGKYYFIKKFDAVSETKAKTMVASIEAAMTKILEDDVDWLDSDTKDEALKKMKQVANLIGHSSRQEHFPFVLSPDSYWSNIETLNAYDFAKSVNRIATTVDRDEWFMPASEVNAYYNPSTNQIVFPAGILQPPIFNKDNHPSQNYGAIGAIIGHEITHGFDDNGRFYDGKGNLVDWWNDKTDASFRKRIDCLINQYSSFEVVSDIDENTVLGHVNGNFTVGENIADNGGVKIAFQALRHYLFDRDEADELKEPSSLSKAAAEQLYFLSFGQVFCAKSTDEAMVRRLNVDPHSPERWRVNGAVMNNADFKRVFECEAGDRMAPKTTCEVW